MKRLWPDRVVFEADREPVSYAEAMDRMTRRVEDIQSGCGPETVWFLQHPPLYTAGPRARADHLLDPGPWPVYTTPRGGEYTWHGPGQRMIYVMLDLKRRGQDVRLFVRFLEEWIMQTLRTAGLNTLQRPGYPGIWLSGVNPAWSKIAALGVHIRRWVTSHGVALNVCPPPPEAFQGIIPCGLEGSGVTSVAECLGTTLETDSLDQALLDTFHRLLPGLA
jgi:lipoyl(octanoyl) transferase